MYPYIRTVKEILTARRQSRLALGETHISQHIIWPWDIDLWMELNNGRALTLFDLGRMGMFVRSGFFAAARGNRWAGTVAGSSVRYRRRLRAFDRVEMRSRFIGWDARFFYAEQGIWRGGECCVHALLRHAVTGAAGIVSPADVAHALGYRDTAADLPRWVEAWIEADGERPWPPMGPLQDPAAAG